ncbi:hypothetical protein [Streptomyces sp. NPDC046821]|uniref:hypothetical protein n=1 Tax=Streptomyces sp. NPDC046821 TaxID=3154702 RepID=UPI0033EA7506
MSFGRTHSLSGEQVAEIFNVRLRPHLPKYLSKVEPNTYSVRYVFLPFTGREPEPMTPERYWEDPNLAFKHMDEEAGRAVADEAEYDLREAARFLLDNVYTEARIEWRNARHIAELKTVVQDTGARWKAHNLAKRACEAAFAYLRDPAAATEWTSAISRLVDAQGTYMKAAGAFDERAQEIAETHDRHFHEEMLGDNEALIAAGYPDGKDWYITHSDYYGRSYRGEYDERTLAGRAQSLIKEQEEHVRKVGSLAGGAVS